MSLRGRAVLITAGPTREPLDPVRYLSNHSTGAMGAALAAEARRRGARVTVVCGPLERPLPPGVRAVPVLTARQMRREVLSRGRRADAVVAAAAVCDFRPARARRGKIKRGKGPLTLALAPNPDIVREAAARRRPGQVFVGFALETARLESRARAKLRAKGLDLVVANGPEALGARCCRAVLVGPDGARRLPVAGKSVQARRIFDEVARLLERAQS